jgi:hypothetical protein
LGRAPRRGEITFIADGRLVAASPSGERVECLVELGPLAGNVVAPTWNAPADRVLLGKRVLSRDLSVTPRLNTRGSQLPQWSRPSGTSVVYLDRRGRLMKGSSRGGAPVDISFLARHDAVTYHPAGKHVAVSGVAEDGTYGLYLATNLGTEPRLLARGETARSIHDLRFAEDGRTLYFTARHGPRRWHLHRLRMGPGAGLETLAEGSWGIEYAVSPFHEGRVAWFLGGDCAMGDAGRFAVVGRDLNVPAELRKVGIQPVGWLPSGDLVVRAGARGCDTAEPGDVYVLSRRPPVLIAEENYGAVSVRASMPPPPRAPGEEPNVVA